MDLKEDQKKTRSFTWPNSYVEDLIIEDYNLDDTVDRLRATIMQLDKTTLKHYVDRIPSTELSQWDDETYFHISQVRMLVDLASVMMRRRSFLHDCDKLLFTEKIRDMQNPEKVKDDILDKDLTILSLLWKKHMASVHKVESPHHSPIVLTDLIEMVADWASASFRKKEDVTDLSKYQYSFKKWVDTHSFEISEAMLSLFIEFRKIILSLMEVSRQSNNKEE